MVELGVGVGVDVGGVYPGGTRVRVLVTAGGAAASAARAAGARAVARRTKALVMCMLNKLVLMEEGLDTFNWAGYGIMVVAV